MRRLAIVDYNGSAGGVERVLRGLARALLEVPEAEGWDITFLVSRYNSAHSRFRWPEELTGPRLRVEYLTARSPAARLLDPLAHGKGILGLPGTGRAGMIAAQVARGAGPRAWRALLGDTAALVARAARRFDLLYFTYPVGMAAPEVATPIVSTPQDFNFLHFGAPTDPWRVLQERVTESWLERSRRLLLTSQAVRDELRRFYPSHDAKVEVVPLGVSLQAVPPTAAEVEEVRRARGLPADFLLSLGWVAEHKNQAALVRAVAVLRQRGLALPIVFAGPNTALLAGEAPAPDASPYAVELRRLLSELGFERGRDYHVLGYASDREVQVLYRLATALVIPSLYEGFGLPSLEAVQAGCPTLVSSIPPFEEQSRLLGGLLATFDPKDPAGLAERLAWLLGHRQEAAASARAAAERLPGVYDWRRTAKAYLKAFDDVLREGGHGSGATR